MAKKRKIQDINKKFDDKHKNRMKLILTLKRITLHISFLMVTTLLIGLVIQIDDIVTTSIMILFINIILYLTLITLQITHNSQCLENKIDAIYEEINKNGKL